MGDTYSYSIPASPDKVEGEVREWVTKRINERIPEIIYQTIGLVLHIKSKQKGRDYSATLAALDDLRDSVRHNGSLEALTDSLDDVAAWNKEIKHRATYDSLRKECLLWMEIYIYRRVAGILHSAKFPHDDFHEAKSSAFHGQFQFMNQTGNYLLDALNETLYMDQTRTELAQTFIPEFLRLCAWTKMPPGKYVPTPDAIVHINNPIVEAAKRDEYLLVDKSDTIVKYLLAISGMSAGDSEKTQADASTDGNADTHRMSSSGTRVDIVLGCSQMELYTVMCLAELLVESGVATQVVFHCGLVPSTPLAHDTEDDILWILRMLERTNTLMLTKMKEMFWKRMNEGSWKIRSHKFWTLPWTHAVAYTAEEHEEFWADLKKSGLIIFQGDLNYRKLFLDRMWEKKKSLKEGILPMLSGTALCAIRVIDSPIVFSDDRTAAEWKTQVPKWTKDGQWAIIDFDQ